MKKVNEGWHKWEGMESFYKWEDGIIRKEEMVNEFKAGIEKELKDYIYYFNTIEFTNEDLDRVNLRKKFTQWSEKYNEKEL